ncbi:ral guanine nucleotide dissociation stimulator-like [Lutra lutra]|uniref:ral guanine nucleotide dissociation stimulator-like n=1 Tax=Lutra lutra TaxID=9657 RepID=UPI001FD5D8FE|nr:ral guanine nucleotide dissociation stimulator-like [Lutra lutra]
MTQDVISYLGTFFTDLVMWDTTMEDYLKGNEINPPKKNKMTQEYRVLMDIMLLQVAAENYTLEPQIPFRAWFPSAEQLSEDDSYILSCQLESWS